MAQIQIFTRFIIKKGPNNFSNCDNVSKVKNTVILLRTLCIMNGSFDDMIIVFRGANSYHVNSNNCDLKNFPG